MAEEETQECPICGVEVGEEATECPECGEPLAEDIDKEEAVERLTEISGLGKNRAEKLYEEGFKSPGDILEGGMKGLAGIDQVGVRTARKIIDEAEKLIEEEELFKEEPAEEIEEDIVEGEKIEEPEEVEEEFADHITEDTKTIVDEEGELNGIPKRVIIGEEIQENVRDFVPIMSGFLIPVFLLIFVASEFVAVLLDYTSIYPAQTLYYFTIFHYLGTSWIVSLTLSLVIVVALFLTTWKGYDFNSVRRLTIDKNMIFYSAVLSFIISVSLMIHIYYSQPYSGKGLTFVFLILALFLLVTQLVLLRKKETVFPSIEERKICVKCSGLMTLDLETCPRCDSKIGVLEEGITKEEEEVEWYSNISFLPNKLRGRSKTSKDDLFSGDEEWKPEVPEWEEEEEEVPPWKIEPDEEEEEEEEEVPPWEKEEE
ncbi:MAG: helix-hairpin-helix domain-containing protein, partial [Candidatus Natronoplasma sp.]